MCNNTPPERKLGDAAPTRICYAAEIFPVDLRPTIPAALSDGVITPDAMRPHLVVHAPIISVQGYHTMPGDFFEALIDGFLIPASRATYSGDGEYVEIKIPHIDFLTKHAGQHSITYIAIQQPFGRIALSEPTTCFIDQTPPGGRGLPQITFGDGTNCDGLSLASIQASQDFRLRGKIPDYAGIDPRDTIHLFSKLEGSETEVASGTVVVGNKTYVTETLFGHENFSSIEAPGKISFYYYVVDVSGNKSALSPMTTLDIS